MFMKSKLLISVLANILGVTMLFAQSGKCGTNVSWELNDGVLTISGTGSMYDYTNNSHPPYYSYKDGITTVAFSEGITYIGNYAFNDFNQLKNITWPTQLEEIGHRAFGSTGFESIEIPNSVKTLNSQAFYGANLSSVSIGEGLESIYGEAFVGCNNLELVIWNAINCTNHATISLHPAFGAWNINSLILGPKVERIPQKIFSSFKISGVILPESLKIIEGAAFSGCSLKDRLIIPASVESIDNGAFSSTELTEVIILSEKLKGGGVGSYIFGQTNNIKSIFVADYEGFAKSSTWASYKSRLKPMVVFNNSEFSYIGQSPTLECSSNIRDYSIEASLPTLEIAAGSYNAKVPVTFIGTQSFNVEVPYTYTIKPASLTARVQDATKVYGDANPQFQTEFSGFVPAETESVITNRGTYHTSAMTSSAVGTYDITLSGATAPNYTIKYEPGTLTIAKAPLKMTPKNKTMIYGDRVPTLEVDYEGLKNNELQPTWTTQPSITTTATSKSNVGSYPITISGGEAKNYEITVNQGTLTIQQASLTATTKDATREYGDDNPDFELSYSGLKNYETAPSWSVMPTFTTPATKNSPVGMYDITASGGETMNYTVQFVNTGKLSVTKAPLTAKARSFTRKQGEENPTFVIDYAGFKNGETSLVLEKEPIATTNATINSLPGTYEIKVSGGQATNYEISYESGTLTVLPSEEPGDPTDNVLAIYNLEGHNNTQVTLPIALTNKHEITGLQFDLYLPDGITVATNDRGKMIVNTTSRMDGNYTLTGSVIDGFARIVGYSADSDSFTGSEGDILNVTLNIGSSLPAGEYTIRMKDIVLSDISGKEYHPADVEAVIKVSNYTIGDVDDSGTININDVVCIINYILNKPNVTFIKEAADVDASGTININDVVVLINRYILHRNEMPRKAAKDITRGTDISDHLYLKDQSIMPGETKDIAVQMTNANEVRAVQGNIKLPEGLKFVTKSNGKLDVKNLDERSEDFTLSCALQEDGSMTFTHYSADGFAYQGNEGGIFTFKIAASETAAMGDFQIDLTGVVLSINGVGYELPDLSSKITITDTDNIESVTCTTNGKKSTYSLSGQFLTQPQRGVNIIRSADGTTRKVLMK